MTIRIPRWAVAAAIALVVGFLFGGAIRGGGLFGETVAAWLQALGSIAAIMGGFEVARRQIAHAEKTRVMANLEAGRVRETERRDADRRTVECAHRVATIALQRMKTITKQVESGALSTVADIKIGEHAVLTDLQTVEGFNASTIPDLVILMSFLPFPGMLSAYRRAMAEYADLVSSLPAVAAGTKAAALATLKANLRAATDGASQRHAEMTEYVAAWLAKEIALQSGSD